MWLQSRCWLGLKSSQGWTGGESAYKFIHVLAGFGFLLFVGCRLPSFPDRMQISVRASQSMATHVSRASKQGHAEQTFVDLKRMSGT